MLQHDMMAHWVMGQGTTDYSTFRTKIILFLGEYHEASQVTEDKR